jgi:hypothetical protein
LIAGVSPAPKEVPENYTGPEKLPGEALLTIVPHEDDFCRIASGCSERASLCGEVPPR